MKKAIVKSLLLGGALAAMLGADGLTQTPKKETLADAIRFEKYKLAAAEAQARKDAAEAASTAQTQSRKARKQGQADSAKPENKPSSDK